MNFFLEKQLTSILPSSFGTSTDGQTVSVIEQMILQLGSTPTRHSATVIMWLKKQSFWDMRMSCFCWRN
jgi:hypothetical protein